MKVMWASNFSAQSAYAQQSKLFTPRIHKLGHPVTVFELSSGVSRPYSWTGNGTTLPIIGVGQDALGNDMIKYYVQQHGIDAVITLVDVWRFTPDVWKEVPFYPWIPIDHHPIPAHVHAPLKVTRLPIAMSKFGRDEMLKAQYPSLYVPLAFDPEIFHPRTDTQRGEVRKQMGIGDDTFLASFVGVNDSTPNRKGIPEMLMAWKLFVQEYPNSVLYLHTLVHGNLPMNSIGGVKIDDLVTMLGIPGNTIRLCDQNRYKAGTIEQNEVADIMGAADVQILLSRGEGFGVPCFPPGAKVQTANGFKAIETLELGDKVLTHTGQLQDVQEVMSRDVVNEPVLNVRTVGSNQLIRLTANHPVLALRRKGMRYKAIRKAEQTLEWLQAGELSDGDFLFMPQKLFNPRKEQIDLGEFVKPHGEYLTSQYTNRGANAVTARKIAEHAGLSVALAHHVLAKEVGHYSQETYERIMTSAHTLGWQPLKRPSRYMPLNEETGFFFGQYIAEGSVGANGQIEFASHHRETHIREKLKLIAETYWNLPGTIRLREGSSADTTFCNTQLAKVLSMNCGKHSLGKHLPSFVYDNVDFARGLLIGMWLGDGSFKTYTSYTTGSEVLAYQLRELCSALGFYATIRENRRKEGTVEWVLYINGYQERHFRALFGLPPKDKVERTRVLPIAGGWLVPIRSIESESYTGKVYNLEVETDHSYCVENMAVHNCIEAQACGTPMITTRFAAQQELVFAGWHVDYESEWGWQGAVLSKAGVLDTVEKLTFAYHQRGNMALRKVAAAGAAGYEIDTVMRTHMLPTLDKIAEDVMERLAA